MQTHTTHPPAQHNRTNTTKPTRNPLDQHRDHTTPTHAPSPAQRLHPDSQLVKPVQPPAYQHRFGPGHSARVVASPTLNKPGFRQSNQAVHVDLAVSQSVSQSISQSLCVCSPAVGCTRPTVHAVLRVLAFCALQRLTCNPCRHSPFAFQSGRRLQPTLTQMRTPVSGTRGTVACGLSSSAAARLQATNQASHSTCLSACLQAVCPSRSPTPFQTLVQSSPPPQAKQGERAKSENKNKPNVLEASTITMDAPNTDSLQCSVK